MTVWPALGTKLSVDKNGTATTFTDVGQVVSIDGPTAGVGQAETTHLQSTWKEFRPTIPDGGEISMEVEFDPTDTGAGGTHGFLKAIAAIPAKYYWRLTYPTTPPTVDNFRAFLTKHSRSAAGAEENLMSSVTLKIDGSIS